MIVVGEEGGMGEVLGYLEGGEGFVWGKNGLEWRIGFSVKLVGYVLGGFGVWVIGRFYRGGREVEDGRNMLWGEEMGCRGD